MKQIKTKNDNIHVSSLYHKPLALCKGVYGYNILDMYKALHVLYVSHTTEDLHTIFALTGLTQKSVLPKNALVKQLPVSDSVCQCCFEKGNEKINEVCKKVSGILAAIMLFAFASGCQKTENTSSVDRTGSTPTINPIQVAALKGPTALGMLNLMNSDKETENYEFTIKSKPDEVVALLTSKSADIAAVPTNLAATLYNKNSSVKLLALNTLGVLYVLEKGDTIQSVKDLKGKTIYSTGQGAVPEYALNYVLEQNGLTVGKDVTVE